MIKNMNNLNNITPNNQKRFNELNQDFEVIESSPLKRINNLKHRQQEHRHNGLLFSSPNIEINKQRTLKDSTTTESNLDKQYQNMKIKFNLTGFFYILDGENNTHKFRNSLLNFKQIKSEDFKIKIRSEDNNIKITFDDLLKQSEKIIFDMNTTTMGIILKEKINLNEKLNSRLILWMNSDISGLDKKLNKIKTLILKSIELSGYETKINLNITGTKYEIEKLLKLQALEDYKILELDKIKNLDTLTSMDNSNNLKKRHIYSFTSTAPTMVDKNRIENSPEPNMINTPITNKNNDNSIFNNTSPIIEKKKGIAPFKFLWNSQKNSLSSYSYSNLRDSSPNIPNEILKETIDNTVTNYEQKIALPNEMTKEDIYDICEVPAIFKPNLVYKFNDGTTFTITNQDFKCLYNNDWANDMILDFFIKYFIEESITKNIINENDVSIMSSFFYLKLISDPTNYYKNVKKWVNNSNLFNKKFIVIPLNISYHWLGCIIINFDKVYNFFQNNINELDQNILTIADIPKINILTFDSLSQADAKNIVPIKQFILNYLEDKCNLSLPDEVVEIKKCLVPQQSNFSDCGFHVISNIRTFFEDPGETIKIWNMTDPGEYKNCPEKINDFFGFNKHRNERENYRAILLHLQRNQVKRKLLEDAFQEKESQNTEDDEDFEIVSNCDIKHKNSNSLSQDEEVVRNEEEDRIDDNYNIDNNDNNTVTHNLLPNNDDIASDQKQPLTYGDEGRDSINEVLKTNEVTSRNILETSPPIPDNELPYTGTTSKYFGESRLKSRQSHIDIISSAPTEGPNEGGNYYPRESQAIDEPVSDKFMVNQSSANSSVFFNGRRTMSDDDLNNADNNALNNQPKLSDNVEGNITIIESDISDAEGLPVSEMNTSSIPFKSEHVNILLTKRHDTNHYENIRNTLNSEYEEQDDDEEDNSNDIEVISL
ncbi:hypothetical protein TPHA_0C04540 [Tetrapisispora phaffii CBS 4417]|uniref:Ubiquitin-like protease family profile domain-containing protein n=1 Tax=Tetrapisispora phaffii (strain ATCC 24235 / CBS 4417 / NBRC 1672 / NRRL Y-8282 / UCD 70-5) TaxID=1071381 RepID=G8BQU3_TETPH|nr:hypothetical protein TPHA_0C04540 [Tetrapisispora phaffii CBS 4417]CCE62605.1 hypothetical protein TPHA_0C04540 [Tetrapisispora phaffii CBS 4417]